MTLTDTQRLALIDAMRFGGKDYSSLTSPVVFPKASPAPPRRNMS